MILKPAQPAAVLLFAIVVAIAWVGVRAQDEARPGRQVQPEVGTADSGVLERGAAIYARQCAECHGDKGQGVEGFYDKPFSGERSVDWLTRRIDRTMPEGEADTCVGEDAAAVARYLHETFYRPSLEPTRTLQHLTVEQHRQSLADLVGSFRADTAVGGERGLMAQYYASRDMRKAEPIAEQVEPDINAAYNPEHPLYEQFDKLGHSVRWSGSLLASATGEYEIIVRTDHAMRLWLNDGKAQGGGIGNEITDTNSVALLDGWLQSEEKTEFRQKVFLLAGRAYPLMLEFSAHTQGVGNKDWHKDQAAKASYVSLHWVPPGGTEQVIPARHLSPARSGEVFVMSAPFPPDDSSMGFISGAQVSEAWLSASTKAAIQTADHLIDHLDELAGTRPKAPDRRERVAAMCGRFVERAFGRPLTEQETALYVDRFFENDADLDSAVKRVVLSALLSPRFLYPLAHRADEPDGFDAAARLSLAMWDGLPDEALWQDAEAGKLNDPATLSDHAKRMLQDPRAKAKLLRFFEQWLELERAEHVSKDDQLFPEFDEHLLADLRTSLDLFLEHTVFAEASDYRELLLADHLYVNGRLAEVYGIELDEAAGDGFVRVRLPADRRSGVITHPYLLTAFAYHNSTSPIHRGVFLTRNIIGRPLNPPPNAIAFSDAEFDPDLTMREKVTAFTRDSACMSCHQTINPLGFSLEHYDSIGRFRTTQKDDKPINAESEFTGDEGETLRLKGARDVAEFAVSSGAAHRGFVRQLYQHTLNRDPSASAPGTLDALTAGFASSGFHVRDLYVSIALEAATRGLGAKQANGVDRPPHHGAKP
ncbi:MAG: DUF1592 domain-containing protein [Phycisphaeraceae bacterium]